MWEVIMSEPTLSAQGMLDFFKLVDKEIIDKMIALSKTINVEKIEPNITRITIDIVTQ